MELDYKKTVLVIEDHVQLAYLLERALQSSYSVVLAKDAEEGLVCLSRNKIDLMLLDISLPGRSGLEFCQLLKLDSVFRRVPIIMISGKRMLEDKVKGLQIGADDYITKPFLIEELLARVEAIIRRTQITLEVSLESRRDVVEIAVGTKAVDMIFNINLN